MLLGARSSMLSARKHLTAADYLQDGLVAMWDGIENAGWGVHDGSATVWKNLMGDSGYDFPNCSSWRENCFDLSSAAATVINDSSLSIRTSKTRTGSNAACTIEMVWKPYNSDGGAKNQLFGFAADGNNTAVVRFETVYSGNWSASNTVSNGLRLNVGNSVTTLSKNTLGYAPNYLSGAYVTAVYDTGVGRAFFNSKSVTEVAATISSWTLPLTIGNAKRSGFGTIPGKSTGQYYRCSWYSRALTADEIAYNYAIDKKRFELP